MLTIDAHCQKKIMFLEKLRPKNSMKNYNIERKREDDE